MSTLTNMKRLPLLDVGNIWNLTTTSSCELKFIYPAVITTININNNLFGEELLAQYLLVLNTVIVFFIYVQYKSVKSLIFKNSNNLTKSYIY